MYPQRHDLRHHQHPPADGPFVTVTDPVLIHHHPKSIVYISHHSWCCTSYMGLGKCIMTYINRYNVVQSISTPL